MPQVDTENTAALRADFAAKLSKAIDGLSRKVAAEKLGVTRQMLNRYLKGKSTPSSEVVKRACDEWKLRMSIRRFDFGGGAFERAARISRYTRLAQLSLLDLLDKLRSDPSEAKVVGREGDSFYLRLRIRV